jgi:hypothetical protein
MSVRQSWQLFGSVAEDTTNAPEMEHQGMLSRAPTLSLPKGGGRFAVSTKSSQPTLSPGQAHSVSPLQLVLVDLGLDRSFPSTMTPAVGIGFWGWAGACLYLQYALNGQKHSAI